MNTKILRLHIIVFIYSLVANLAHPVTPTFIKTLGLHDYMFGLAFGFLVGQVTSNELVMNAASNITGLIISFLGGVWVSLDLVGEPVATVAKFTPTYYYNEALHSAFDASGGGFTPEVLANMGIICLFALAVFAIGLAISRVKVGRMGVWKGSSTKASLRPAA